MLNVPSHTIDLQINQEAHTSLWYEFIIGTLPAIVYITGVKQHFMFGNTYKSYLKNAIMCYNVQTDFLQQGLPLTKCNGPCLLQYLAHN